jgi:hypothetical protein
VYRYRVDNVLSDLLEPYAMCGTEEGRAREAVLEGERQ